MSLRFIMRLSTRQRLLNGFPGNKMKYFHSNSARVLKELDLPEDGTRRQVVDRKIARGKAIPIGSLYPAKFTKSAKVFEKFMASSRTRDGFATAIEEHKRGDLNRLRTMEFITTSMRYMEQFGVTKDVDIYNQIMDIFPRGRYEYKTVFDTVWTRHRPQIDTAIKLLTRMEENGVRPNVDTYDIVQAIFGDDSIPMAKLRRIVFWFDKFDEMYPHPLPPEMPTDNALLYQMAIMRMFGEEAPVFEFKHNHGNQSIWGTHDSDMEVTLESYGDKKPLFVEGPFSVWLRRNQLYYYVLQMDKCLLDSKENGVLATCLADNMDEERLKHWLKELQLLFPALTQYKIIFNILKP